MSNFFKRIFFLYFVAIAVCTVCRIALKLYFINPDTGFYTRSTIWEIIFNWTLASAVILLIAANCLKKADNDYPLKRQGASTGVLAVLAGISITVYALDSARLSRQILLLGTTGRMLNLALGILSGISLVYTAIIRRRGSPNGALAIIPCVWQIFLLVNTFNSYTTLVTISDNLLAVLFMVFSSLFLLGHARSVCSIGRMDGRNYVVSTGLCASLCGILLVIPNYAHMLISGSGLSSLTLGGAESVCILLLGLYAFAFVWEFGQSIAIV